ncbi:bacteriohemerythrin [Clostridium sp. BSD9I1]|uniref:bacteriohemerythrin n=1 Tax=Clostridium sp. BSD9I1 TaxID=2003589 RepID=UPI001647E282|nr:hemerythrin family protein [Clostridium sp. BSD9I1]
MFEWKEQYDTGVNAIDKEHKRLFEIGSQIYALAKNDNYIDYYDKIMDLIEELKSYTVYHFNNEEKIMKLYEYPKYDEQKDMHYKFIQKINNLDLKEIDANQQGSILELLEFVCKWIESHILKEDVQIRDYLQDLKTGVKLKLGKRY